MKAVRVFYHQLSAVVLIGLTEEQRRRKIRAHAMRRSRYLPNRVIDVVTKRLPALVTIEQGRKNLERQRGRHKQRIPFEGNKNRVAKLFCVFVIFRQLQVVFSARRLMTSRGPTVNPIVRLEQLATCDHLLGSQNLWNLQQHSLEPETRAQHRGASRPRHNVSAADPIEIKLVSQVVEIELQIDML